MLCKKIYLTTNTEKIIMIAMLLGYSLITSASVLPYYISMFGQKSLCGVDQS